MNESKRIIYIENDYTYADSYLSSFKSRLKSQGLFKSGKAKWLMISNSNQCTLSINNETVCGCDCDKKTDALSENYEYKIKVSRKINIDIVFDIIKELTSDAGSDYDYAVVLNDTVGSIYGPLKYILNDKTKAHFIKEHFDIWISDEQIPRTSGQEILTAVGPRFVRVLISGIPLVKNMIMRSISCNMTPTSSYDGSIIKGNHAENIQCIVKISDKKSHNLGFFIYHKMLAPNQEFYNLTHTDDVTTVEMLSGLLQQLQNKYDNELHDLFLYLTDRRVNCGETEVIERSLQQANEIIIQNTINEKVRIKKFQAIIGDTGNTVHPLNSSVLPEQLKEKFRVNLSVFEGADDKRMFYFYVYRGLFDKVIESIRKVPKISSVFSDSGMVNFGVIFSQAAAGTGLINRIRNSPRGFCNDLIDLSYYFDITVREQYGERGIIIKMGNKDIDESEEDKAILDELLAEVNTANGLSIILFQKILEQNVVME